MFRLIFSVLAILALLPVASGQTEPSAAAPCDTLWAVGQRDSAIVCFRAAREAYKQERVGKTVAEGQGSSQMVQQGMRHYNRIKGTCGVTEKRLFTEAFFEEALVSTREVRMLRPAMIFQEDRAKLYSGGDIHDTNCKCGKCPIKE